MGLFKAGREDLIASDGVERIDMETLMDYISHARQHVKPAISDEAPACVCVCVCTLSNNTKAKTRCSLFKMCTHSVHHLFPPLDLVSSQSLLPGCKGASRWVCGHASFLRQQKGAPMGAFTHLGYCWAFRLRA